MSREDDIVRLRDQGDLRGAAARLIEIYGPEVLGFLVAWLRSEVEASEVFSQACEDLWASFGRFEGRASYRAWFYTLARHAASRLRRAAHRRPGRNVAISQAGELAAQLCTRTLPILRSEVKDQIAAIREALAPDDRALLVLRVDRGLEWSDIARVLADGADAMDQDALKRAAARWRKRFQLVKEEIRERARAAGILGDD